MFDALLTVGAIALMVGVVFWIALKADEVDADNLLPYD